MSINNHGYKKMMVLKYLITNCEERQINVIQDEYLGRDFDGTSGLLNISKVEIIKERNRGYNGVLFLSLVLKTDEYVADYEAPFIMSAILEKFDKKKILGKYYGVSMVRQKAS
jgi:hypothetical protein